MLYYIIYVILPLYIYFVLFRYFFYIYIWFDTSLFVWTHLFHRMPSKGHCKSPFHLSGLIADTVAAFLLLHTSSKSTRQSQSQHNEARRRNSLSQRLWLWTSPCDVSSWYISGIVGHDSNTRITWHDFAPVVSGKNDDSKRRLWNKLKSTGVIPGHLLLQIILMGLHCSFQDLVLGGFLVSPWYPTTLRRFDTCKIWRSDPSWGFETVGITSTVDSAVDDSLLEGACFFCWSKLARVYVNCQQRSRQMKVLRCFSGLLSLMMILPRVSDHLKKDSRPFDIKDISCLVVNLNWPVPHLPDFIVFGVSFLSACKSMKIIRW